jgi:cytidine deaminase
MAEDLIAAALAARSCAYAPYSNFKVGAALRDEKGRIHQGCNVENVAYPEGLCAEAAALAAMVMSGSRRCLELALVSDSELTVMPCGGCRQKLKEFGGDDMRIFSCDAAGALRRTFLLGELLPFAFGPHELGIEP